MDGLHFQCCVIHIISTGCSWIHGYNEGNPARGIAEHYQVKCNVPNPTPMRIIGPKGALPTALSEKLSSNLSKAQASLTAVARSEGSSAPPSTSSLASHLLSSSSPLYSNLSSEEKEYATALARSMHVPLGATLEDVSLRYWGYEQNFGGTDAAPEGGFSRLIDLISEDAKSSGCEIKLGEVVEQVEQTEDGKIKIVTKTESGERRSYDAETALCTIPLSVLKESVHIFKPALPERRQATIVSTWSTPDAKDVLLTSVSSPPISFQKRTHIGSLNKVLMTYSAPWWSSEIGTFMVLPTSTSTSPSSSIEEVLSRATLIVSSLCAPNGLPGSSPSLLIYVGTPASQEIEKHSRADVVSALHKIISPRISEKEAKISEPIHTFYSRWNKQAFTKGATTTPVTIPQSQHDEAPSPLDFRELGLSLWKGRLGFAGEATEMDHRGSVAGAVVSGEREAKRIDSLLKGIKAGKASL